VENTDDLTVMFVQDPMIRLYEFFRDNIARPNSQFYDRYTKSIIRKTLHVAPPFDAADGWGYASKINFTMFAQWVGTTGYLMENLTPITILCPVCGMNLQFIGHSFDLPTELRLVLLIKKC
jgi:hypothetical protein